MDTADSLESVPICRIELFGGLRVTIAGRIVPIPRERKAADLLAYLAYAPQIKHPRERVQEIFWPDTRSKDSLNEAVSRLGKCLEPGGSVRNGIYLYSDRSVLALNTQNIQTDVAEFEHWLRSAQKADALEEKIQCLEQANRLYRGELLPEFYEEWTDQERRRWEEAHRRMLQTLVQVHVRQERFEEALDYARQWVKADALEEQAHQTLLALHVKTGGLDVALRYAHTLQSEFRRDGLTLSPDTLRLIQQIERRAANTVQNAPEQNSLIPLIETAPENPASLVRSRQLEPTGGAVPLGSAFYIQRPADREFAGAIDRRDSIVLVKGPRQTGKTSLLSRGLHYARGLEARIVYTNFHLFSEALFESADTFMDALADAIREQLDLPEPATSRSPLADPNSRFERFLRREVLHASEKLVVWGMDGVDRLFHYAFGQNVFVLMRSWHESRATLPDGPWHRLTLAISLSTEPYLYIRNLNQSPFNVGTRLDLDDFSPAEVAALNRQYDSPLRSEAELTDFHHLLGGHPFLTHQGLHEMRQAGTTFAELSARAEDTAWIFGAHLRTLYALLEQEQEMAAAAGEVFNGKPCPTRDSFDRLRSAGVLCGTSTADARPRCELYTRYLLPRFTERFSG